MAVFLRGRASFTRRHVLRGLASIAPAVIGSSLGAPAISRAADRPILTHGLQSGDVSDSSAIVWARADRPARMLVEASTSERFDLIRCATYADALPETDYTAKVQLDDLPAGEQVFYRIQFQDHAAPTILSETQVGRFRTAPRERQSLSFVWSGDVCGQGWGIDEARGGLRTFATMRADRPDFFIHSGDSIYADCTIPSQLTLPNGETWNNIVTPEKSKVAETLDEFRGNYKYNLLDRNLRAFNAEVPVFAQWDDHEVTNDWCPGEAVTWNRYTEKSILALTARGSRAFHEYMPIRPVVSEGGRVYRKIAHGPLLDIFMVDMRSYRTSLERGDISKIFGDVQLAWLKRELLNSRATWKVIAADLPIGIESDDAVALENGPPRGREVEVAELLTFIKRAGICNTVWLTADMHYTAAHYYDPNAAVFQDFEPFWEFVSGPLHAGTWSPGSLDNTFGPRCLFQKGCTKEQGENLAPCFGLQFYGHVAIDGATEVMTVTLKDVDGRSLWSVDIDPRRSVPKRDIAAVRS
jgi:alkaline phosphatase D